MSATTPAATLRHERVENPIGDGDHLRSLGINVVHNLPGVGQNLQDHPDFVFGYMSDNPNFNGISLKALPRLLRAIGQYRRERRGPMTSNFAECGGFLKTRPDLEVPDIQLHFGMAIVDDHGALVVDATSGDSGSRPR